MTTQRNTTKLNPERRREPGRGRIANNAAALLTSTDSTQRNGTRPVREKTNSQEEVGKPKIEHRTVESLKEVSKTLRQSYNGGGSAFARQIRINVHLFDTIQNAINSAILGGNYRFGSAADFIREALKDHAAGGELRLSVEKGPRKLMSLRLNEELKNFWDSLPLRQKQNILERALRTKLAFGKESADRI